MVTSLRQTRHVPRLPSELHCITISYDGAHGVWSGEARCVWRDSGLWATSQPAHPRSRISRAKCQRRGTKAASQATVLQTEHDEYDLLKMEGLVTHRRWLRHRGPARASQPSHEHGSAALAAPPPSSRPQVYCLLRISLKRAGRNTAPVPGGETSRGEVHQRHRA